MGIIRKEDVHSSFNDYIKEVVDYDSTITSLNENTQNIINLQNSKASVTKGIWTPLLVGTSGSCTYTIQDGTYIKIDDLVTCHFRLKIESISSLSGYLSIQGLPFTPSKEATMIIGDTDKTSGVIHLPLFGSLGLDGVAYLKQGATSVDYTPPVSGSDIVNGFTIIGQVTYRI